MRPRGCLDDLRVILLCSEGVREILDDLICRLDELSWGFRIEKLQERGGPSVWRISYVNPKNCTWYESMDLDLSTALQGAIDRLTT